MNKTGSDSSPENILADFYGPKVNTESPWPYVTKDSDRYDKTILFFFLFVHFTPAQIDCVVDSAMTLMRITIDSVVPSENSIQFKERK